MIAAIYREFLGEIAVETVPDPVPHPDGVVLRTGANGICRSDWHGWMGHDPDISLPHVPGHEIAGVVEEVGAEVTRWRPGDRVVVPFIAGCGRCRCCRRGEQQVCERQFQPGFHGWGGFAERVGLRHADLTLAALPDEIDFVSAASLGCRLGTAFRAVQRQGQVAAGDWVAVHGCGGVGLAAVMVARAAGANVVAVDIRQEALVKALDVGAVATVKVSEGGGDDVVEQIRDLSDGGAHLSLDALGHPDTCVNSVKCLRRRGRHVQVGLMAGEQPRLPMDRIIGWELEVAGSHGLQGWEYERLLRMVQSGQVKPQELVTQRVSLRDGVEILTGMDGYDTLGIAVIDRFA